MCELEPVSTGDFQALRTSLVRQVNAPATPALPPSMAVGQLLRSATNVGLC